MEPSAAPNWAVGDPQVLAEQFVNITGDCIKHSPNKYFALVAAIAAAAVHNVLTTSPPGSRQQQIDNIRATAAAVVEPYRGKPRRGQRPNAGARRLPKSLVKLDKMIEELQQQEPQEPQQEPQLITAAFEAYLRRLGDLDSDADDFDDGSHVAGFVSLWPLDGSAAAGADLKEDGTWRTFRMFYADAGFLGSLSRLMAPGGMDHLKAQMAEKISNREPSALNSSPLALFVDSKPQAMHSSRASQAAAAAAAKAAEASEPAAAALAAAASSAAGPSAAPTGAEPGASSKRPKRTPAAAAAAAGAAAAGGGHGLLTDACCDIKVLEGARAESYVMHIDGDLLCFGYASGFKFRDPGFGGAVLRYVPKPPADSSTSQQQQQDTYGLPCRRGPPKWGLVADSGEFNAWLEVDHGLFSKVSRVCADAGNALMWCAGDGGERIKGFRAPDHLGGPRNTDAACNRGEDNGMDLQYTLQSRGKCAGLHVIGTRVLSVTGVGGLLSWDLAHLPPQGHKRQSHKAYESGEDSQEGSDGEGPIYKGDLDMRDMDNAELECSEGVLPTQTQTLQLPSTAAGKGRLGQTCLVGQTCSTLAASWKGVSPYQQANAVLTFDLQTQRPVNAFMGHLYPITGIAAAPAAWPGSEHLFATVGASRDVKIWDVRCSGGAAAVTLVTGGQWSMSSVVLASNSGGSSGGSSSGGSSGGGSQLGAGLMCFAGGVCESVWAWDVRASSAQALYQLSTGNQEVSSLAWHEASSSLIACCDAHYDWRDCKPFDPRPLGVATPPASVAGEGDSQDEGKDAGEEFEDDFSDGYAEDYYIWPTVAKHEPGDFRKFYTVVQSNVLGYTFTSEAAQLVPEVEV